MNRRNSSFCNKKQEILLSYFTNSKLLSALCCPAPNPMHLPIYPRFANWRLFAACKKRWPPESGWDAAFRACSTRNETASCEILCGVSRSQTDFDNQCNSKCNWRKRFHGGASFPIEVMPNRQKNQGSVVKQLRIPGVASQAIWRIRFEKKPGRRRPGFMFSVDARLTPLPTARLPRCRPWRRGAGPWRGWPRSGGRPRSRSSC